MQQTHIYNSTFKFKKKPDQLISKVVAFDLDETLGSFGSLDVLWRGLIQLKREKPGTPFKETQEYFDRLLDLYPEFLRTGILPILRLLSIKKEAGKCDGVFIYTNNQCPPSWTEMIANYLSKRANSATPLFDKLILAFKLKNRPLETMRTSNDKLYSDLIRCAMLTTDTEILFMDNTFYPGMKTKRVYFVQPKAYFHGVSVSEIMRRIASVYKESTFWNRWFEGVYHTESPSPQWMKDEDTIVAKKMMYHLQEFFLLTTVRPPNKQKTQKIYGRFSKRMADRAKNMTVKHTRAYYNS
jgi:hypothetical protein